MATMPRWFFLRATRSLWDHFSCSICKLGNGHFHRPSHMPNPRSRSVHLSFQNSRFFILFAVCDTRSSLAINRSSNSHNISFPNPPYRPARAQSGAGSQLAPIHRPWPGLPSRRRCPISHVRSLTDVTLSRSPPSSSSSSSSAWITPPGIPDAVVSRRGAAAILYCLLKIESR